MRFLVSGKALAADSLRDLASLPQLNFRVAAVARRRKIHALVSVATRLLSRDERLALVQQTVITRWLVQKNIYDEFVSQCADRMTSQ